RCCVGDLVGRGREERRGPPRESEAQARRSSPCGGLHRGGARGRLPDGTRVMRGRGLPFRLLIAHLLVVAVSLLAAAAVACLAGPPLFQEHLAMAGREVTGSERFHIQQAYQDAGLITVALAMAAALLWAMAAGCWGC